MKNIGLETASILLKIKCVSFSTKKKFRLTSGKESPVYCDCRRIISYPTEREKLINFGVKKIAETQSLAKILGAISITIFIKSYTYTNVCIVSHNITIMRGAIFP